MSEREDYPDKKNGDIDDDLDYRNVTARVETHVEKLGEKWKREKRKGEVMSSASNVRGVLAQYTLGVLSIYWHRR